MSATVVGVAPAGYFFAIAAEVAVALPGTGARRAMLWVLPIAAVLAASTALATNGSRLHQAWQRLVGRADVVNDAHSVDMAPPDVSSASSAEVEIPRGANTEFPVTAPAVTPLPDVPVAPVATVHQRGVPSPTPSARSSQPAPKTEEAHARTTHPIEPPSESDQAPLVLYKKAHRLHFQEQNYARALDAWNDYLRAQPSGGLSVEARYNRALALVRVGRRDEARASLEPFARGQLAGGYRSAEAQSLLLALEESAR